MGHPAAKSQSWDLMLALADHHEGILTATWPTASPSAFGILPVASGRGSDFLQCDMGC